VQNSGSAGLLAIDVSKLFRRTYTCENILDYDVGYAQPRKIRYSTYR
jgi:hypothetical protein